MTDGRATKDACSQTSDPESRAAEQLVSKQRPHHQSAHRSRSRRAYDYRRATSDALMTPLPSPNQLSPNVSFEEGATASVSVANRTFVWTPR